MLYGTWKHDMEHKHGNKHDRKQNSSTTPQHTFVKHEQMVLAIL